MRSASVTLSSVEPDHWEEIALSAASERSRPRRQVEGARGPGAGGCPEDQQRDDQEPDADPRDVAGLEVEAPFVRPTQNDPEQQRHRRKQCGGLR